MIYCTWNLRRLRRAEMELIEFVHQDCYKPDDDLPLGQACSEKPKVFSALQWRMDANRRALDKAYKFLRQVQANECSDAAREAAFAPESLPATATIQAASPEIGFVPITPVPTLAPTFEIPATHLAEPLSGPHATLSFARDEQIRAVSPTEATPLVRPRPRPRCRLSQLCPTRRRRTRTHRLRPQSRRWARRSLRRRPPAQTLRTRRTTLSRPPMDRRPRRRRTGGRDHAL